jgi:hypothetical protein
LEVLVRGEAGHRYRLLAAPEVTNNLWMEVAAGVAVSNGPLSFTISNHLPREFFRAMTP